MKIEPVGYQSYTDLERYIVIKIAMLYLIQIIWSNLEKWKLNLLDINPLRAKFFRGNINICLHFLPFLHPNKTQVVEIPARVRQGPAYSI